MTPSYFAVIPASVRYDAGLKPNAKLLYGEISALCDKEGFCWAGNDYFAQLYGVDHKTISRWISQLQAQNHILVILLKREGNKRKITIDKNVTRYTQNSHHLVTKKSLASDEIVTSYNRINNTINNTKNEAANAIDFLIENYPGRYEQDFEIKYRSKIKDFEKFEQDFNDTVTTEKRDFDAALFGRLGKYARNWIQNQEKYGKKDKDVEPQTYRNNAI